MLSTEQEYVNLEFALKDKQIACMQNIVDGRDVVGILMTLRGGTHKPQHLRGTRLHIMIAWQVFTHYFLSSAHLVTVKACVCSNTLYSASSRRRAGVG